MSMILYDWKNSYNSRKIRAVAFECDQNIDAQSIDIMAGETRTPKYLAMNPNGKVPVLKDEDFCLWESNAIMCYVASKNASSKLLPTNPSERARVDQWLFWQTAHLSPSIGKISFEKIWKAKLGMGQEDPKAIEAAMPEVERYLKVLDGELAKNEWVVGKNLSVVDFACAAAFMMRREINLDLANYSNISRWLDKVESRPSWKNAAW